MIQCENMKMPQCENEEFEYKKCSRKNVMLVNVNEYINQ